MLRLAVKGLAARPLRTALTTLAIVLGVALVSGALTLTDTQRRAADSLSAASYDGTAAVVSQKTAFAVDSADDWAIQRPTVDAALLDEVRAVPGVAVAVGDVTDQNAKIVGKDGKPIGEGPYFGVGYDAATKGAERVNPFELESGTWATGPGQVVIDAKTAEDEGYAVGDRVEISGRGDAEPFRIVGVARFGEVKSLGPATVAVFATEVAQRMFDKGDDFDSILVAAEAGTAPAEVRAALSRALPASAQVQSAAAHDRFTFDGLEMFISIIRGVLLAFGGIAILVGALTILNSLSITVAQRTRELGLMRMVGASRRQVLGSVLAEALAIGMLGSLAGMAAGYGMAAGLQSLFASLGLELPDAGTVFDTGTVVASLLVGTLVTVVAGMVPALRATRVSPVAALREGDAGTQKVGLAGRAIRPVVGLLGRPGERIAGAAGLLARRNAMRQPGRTASTALALTIGVALVTLVAVVAAGLKDTTTGDLERRIAASHVITGSDGWSPTDPQAADAVRGVPGVQAVGELKMDGARAFGDTERVNAVSAGTELVRFDAVAGDVSAGGLGRDGAIVDEGWAEEHGLRVGERFEIVSAKGEKVALTVRGIEGSPILDGLDLGPITIGQAAFEAAFEGTQNNLVLVDAGPGATAAIDRALGAFPDTQSQAKAAFVDDRTSDIDTLMAIFAVLLALAVIVSLFGITNAMVLATFERRRELGMLQAIGMTRRQIRRMVRHESIVTALLGAATGIAAGLALGALVTSLFSDQGLTFAVPAGNLVVVAILAVVAGTLAAIVPARRAARMSPLSALAYE